MALSEDDPRRARTTGGVKPSLQYGDLTNQSGVLGQGETAPPPPPTPPNTPLEKVFAFQFIVQVGCTPVNPQIPCTTPVPQLVCPNPNSVNYGPGTQFYDPSYGVIYPVTTTMEAGFESLAITGYAAQINGEARGGTDYHFRSPVVGSPKVCFSLVSSNSF